MNKRQVWGARLRGRTLPLVADGANREIPETEGKGFPMAMGLVYRAQMLRDGSNDRQKIASALHAMGWDEHAQVFFSLDERQASESAKRYPWAPTLSMLFPDAVTVWVEGEWTRPTGFQKGRPYEDGKIAIYKLWEFDPERAKNDPKVIPDDPLGIKQALKDFGELLNAAGPLALLAAVYLLSKHERR